MPMSNDVYINYSSKNKAVADCICSSLENRGIRCRIASRDVPPGVPSVRALVEAISSAKAMVLIYSSNTCDSENTLRENDPASKRHIPVIPFHIEDVAPTPEIAATLKCGSRREKRILRRNSMRRH